MENISISQGYLLCALNERGVFRGIDSTKQICFIASALYELIINGFVALEDKKIVVKKELTTEFSYLEPIYTSISNSKPEGVERVVAKYFFTFTSKGLNILVNSIGDKLILSGSATEKRTIFNKKRIIPNKLSVDKEIQKIRTKVFEKIESNDDPTVLLILLNKANLIKKFFSKYESKEIKKRLKETKDFPPNQLIQQMLDYVAISTMVVSD